MCLEIPRLGTFVHPTSTVEFVCWYGCLLQVYAYNVGYQEVIINKVPCISCEHGNHRPTPSTVPSLQYKTHPRTETFHYTSELIEDFWQRLRLGEETVLSAFKLRGIEHQGNKEFIPKNWRECRSRRARTKQLVRDVPPVQEAPRKV